MATRVDTLEPIPIPEPERPPERKLSPAEWAKKNLFSTWYNGVLTVGFGLLLGWAAFRVLQFVFVDARWEIIERNLRLLLVFRFPREETWRLWTALAVLAASVGLGAGAAAKLRAAEVAEGRAAPLARYLAVRRVAPLVLLVVVILVFAQSLTATLFTAGVAAVAIAFRFLGRRIPRERVRWVAAAVLAGIIAAFVVLTRFGGVPASEWGGFHLTLYLAVGGILLSFPLGVLLALGRRSTLPLVRIVCAAYIELVRGGLQAVPRGQIEAAMAVGLSPLKTTRLILLPQALRAVIPGLVGQFISLFKDTSLVFIIGLTELLGVAELMTKQPDFLAQGLIFEALVFAAFVYWAGSYWMSRESQRLERRLGVGER